MSNPSEYLLDVLGSGPYFHSVFLKIHISERVEMVLRELSPEETII